MQTENKEIIFPDEPIKVPCVDGFVFLIWPYSDLFITEIYKLHIVVSLQERIYG